jgi:hypothetical protein
MKVCVLVRDILEATDDLMESFITIVGEKFYLMRFHWFIISFHLFNMSVDEATIRISSSFSKQ